MSDTLNAPYNAPGPPVDWFFRLFSRVDEVFARLPVEELDLTEQLDGQKEWLLRMLLAGEPEDVLVEAVDEMERNLAAEFSQFFS